MEIGGYMKKWEEISELLTDKAKKELKTGQVLIFEQEGSKVEWKVRRIDRKRNKFYIAPVYLMTPEELNKKLEGKDEKD